VGKAKRAHAVKPRRQSAWARREDAPLPTLRNLKAAVPVGHRD